MANAQQPTRCTRHLETATFALQDWVERDLLQMTYVASHKNSSDGLTKPLSRILFYKHFDILMGRMIPERFRKAREKVSENNKMAEKNNGLEGSNNTTMDTNDHHANNLPMICSLCE